jgi:hypothetical protein
MLPSSWLRISWPLCLSSALLTTSSLLATTPASTSLSAWPPHQPYQRFVRYVPYQSDSVPQKRTPRAKLPDHGRAAIRRVEALLAATYQVLVASDTGSVLSSAQQDTLFGAWLRVTRACPKWNAYPYRDEATFYQRVHIQRRLTHLQQDFANGQRVLDSLRTRAQARALHLSFTQAAQAGLLLQQAQHGAEAEVYLARCLALRPQNLPCRVQHAALTHYCISTYFARYKRLADAYWRQAPPGPRPAMGVAPGQWTSYLHALPHLQAYLDQLEQDYSTLWQAGQREYLFQQMDVYADTPELVPGARIHDYRSRVQTTLDAYRACYGPDATWRNNMPMLRYWERLPLY